MVTDEMLKRAIEAYAKDTGAEDWQLDGWINSAIRAALEAALSAQVQDVPGWQDISTAPRDGTTVLLYAPGWDSPKTGWTYGKDDWRDCPYSHKGSENYLPTHWMPLPAAPAKQEG